MSNSAKKVSHPTWTFAFIIIAFGNTNEKSEDCVKLLTPVHKCYFWTYTPLIWEGMCTLGFLKIFSIRFMENSPFLLSWVSPLEG